MSQEMSSSGDLERMKSLSSAGHHGGVRVFHDTVEIARLSTAVFFWGWVLGGAKRWRSMVEKRKAGLIYNDFNGFLYTKNQRTIHQCALRPIFIHHCRQLGISAPTKHKKNSGVLHLWVGDIQNKGPPSFDIRSFIIYNPIYDNCRDKYPQ